MRVKFIPFFFTQYWVIAQYFPENRYDDNPLKTIITSIEAARDKAAVVWLPTTHHENYPG